MRAFSRSTGVIAISRTAGKPSRPRRAALHTAKALAATPLPHPSAPGPPPKAPVPAATTESEDRAARKQRHAEIAKLGQALRASSQPASGSSALNRHTALPRRFWKSTHILDTEEGLQIMLDSRPVRIMAKNILKIPRNKRSLAMAIALEWDLLVTAQQALKQHYIPLTALAVRALDIQQADAQGQTAVRESIVQMCMRYLSTDTLLCWAPPTSLHDAIQFETRKSAGEAEDNQLGLREQQEQTAQPIMDFLSQHVWPGVELVPTLHPDSIIPQAQPEMTTSVIRGWLTGLPAYELAGLERAVLATKSLLIAARLVVEWSPEFANLTDQASVEGNRFGIEEARHACSLEVAYQTNLWGEVEDTHDVDKEDLRRQLGSVILLIHGST